MQSPVVPQGELVGSRHGIPGQQSLAPVQACPGPPQVLVWQVPLVEPGGIKHEYPLQQSAVLVHTDPCGWQARGGWQVLLPVSQRSEQQSLLFVQLVRFAWHTPASGVPASPEPASGVPPLGGV